MKAGQIFYSNSIKMSPNDQCALRIPDGSVMGVILGYLKSDAEMPESHIMWQLIGSIGLVHLDDVKMCLGENACDKLMAYHKEKYSEETKVLPGN